MFYPNFKFKRTRLLSAGVLMLASTAAWSQGNNLFADTQVTAAMQNYHYGEPGTTQAVHFMAASAAMVSANSQIIALEVEPGVVVNAYQQQFKDNNDGTRVWIGVVSDTAHPSIEESALNEVILVSHGDNVTGSINVNGQLYMIDPLGDGTHAIIKTDPSKIAEDENDTIEESSAHSTADESSSDEHDHSEHENTQVMGDVNTKNAPIQIRVMVATTNQLRARVADVPGRVAWAIADANNGFRNSKINIELVNAGIFNANYNELSTIAAMLSQSRNTSDPVFGGPVHRFREENRADLVVTLVNQVRGSSCGQAQFNANKSNAVSVTSETCLSGRTFAHEIGHNLGAHHDPGNTNNSTYSYGHGYQQQTVRPYFATVMAYPTCKINACPRINYWSNPDVTYENIPMGTAARHDNARVLNQRAQTVANFYPPMTHWIQSGELVGNGTLPARQFFTIQLKNKTTGQVIYSLDSVIVDGNMNAWPTATAREINSHFPANTLRAGEMDSNGSINVIVGSSYRNKLWVHDSLSSQNQVELTRHTYAETHNQKWVSIAGIESAEQAGTPGTQKLALLKNSQDNQEVARVSLLLTESNAGAWSWPEQLARAVNASNTQEMRAGEIQANGSIAVAAGSSYRNQIWVPLAKRQALTASIETVSAAPVSWNQTGALLGSADLPARQFFQVQLKNLASGKMQSAFSLPFSNTSMYHWPTEIGEAINSRLSANEVRAGERDAASGVITLIKGSHYRNNLWISSILDGKLQLQINQGTYGEALGDKWVSKYNHNELDATPGTTKVVTVRNSTTHSIVKEVKLPITSANFGRYQWISDLTRALNAETPATLRAGEMQADGTLQWIAGSSYRNHIWLPLAQNDQLTVTIETRDANGNLVN